MMKRFLAFLGLTFMVATATPAFASAAFDPLPCSGAASQSAVCQSKPAGTAKDPVTHTIQNVTSIVAGIAGFAAIVIIVIAGINYTTSSGDSAKVTSAKNTIIYAVIGLVVIVFARSIIVFITNRL